MLRLLLGFDASQTVGDCFWPASSIPDISSAQESSFGETCEGALATPELLLINATNLA